MFFFTRFIAEYQLREVYFSKTIYPVQPPQKLNFQIYHFPTLVQIPINKEL